MSFEAWPLNVPLAGVDRPADRCIHPEALCSAFGTSQIDALSEALVLQGPTPLPQPHPALTVGHKLFGPIQLIMSGLNALGSPPNSMGRRIIKQESQCPQTSGLLSTGMICIWADDDYSLCLAMMELTIPKAEAPVLNPRSWLHLCHQRLRLHLLCIHSPTEPRDQVEPGSPHSCHSCVLVDVPVWPYTSWITFLGLSFLIYETEIAVIIE